MSVWALAHFFSCIVNLFMATYILIKNVKRILNWLCATTVFFFALWSFGTTFMRNPAIEERSASIFNNIAAIGWIGFSALFLLFALQFRDDTTLRKKRNSRWLYRLALLIIPAVFIALQFQGLFMREYRLEPYGWVGVWPSSATTLCFYFYYAGFMIVSLIIIHGVRKKTQRALVRKQAGLLIVSVVISMILGSVASIVLRYTGIYSVPPLGDVFTVIFAAGLFYATVRYRLFEFSPSSVANRILDTMTDGLLLIDTRGKIVECNPALLNMLGYSHDELLNKKFTTIIPERIFNSSYIKELLRNESFADRKGSLLAKDGREVPVLGSAGVIKDEDEIAGFVLVVHDYTALEKAQEELIFARDAAEAANRAKSAFLANMSHEIRTPLNAILGFAQILMTAENEPQKKEKLSIIMQSGENLLRILNDILDFSRIESGKIDLFEIDFSIEEMCRQIVSMFSIRAEEKGITFEAINISSTVPRVRGDKQRIMQIISNLLDNAIKFTEKGRVKLEYGFEKEKVIFRVIDTGIGIPPEKQEAIFQPFDQVDPSITRRYGGAGLGLAIVRQLVEMMHGTIECRSVEGEGTVFTVMLPLPVSQSEEEIPHFNAIQPEVKLAVQKSDRGLRVLVVEDNDLNQNLLCRLLEMLEMEFDSAFNGKEALEKLESAWKENRPFELVLLDIQMPVMDGLECIAEIRAHQNFKSLFVVALTAHALLGDAERLKSSGFDEYMSKPIDINDFFQRMKLFAETIRQR